MPHSRLSPAPRPRLHAPWRTLSCWILSGGLGLAALPHAALAQDAGGVGNGMANGAAGSVVSQARDAFGQRIGNEEIGLYTEGQVRGFSLENAGNYRMDGHYYVRAARLPDVVLAGVAIEVGANALATDFPAPSGIVASRLRRPGAGTAGLTVEAGIRPQFAPMVEMKGWLASADGALGVAGGALVNPHILYSDGTRGEEYAVGAVPRARIGALNLTGLAAWQHRRFNGNYSFRSANGALPPELKGIRLFAPPWQRFRNDMVNLGGMADWSTPDGWERKAGLFWSSSSQPENDFTMMTLNPDGTARTTAIAVRDQYTRSLSGEVLAGRRFEWLGIAHRLTGAARYRRTTTRATPGQSFDLGLVDLDARDFGPPPVLDGDMVYSHGLVRQDSIGLSYEMDIAGRVRIQAGVQRAFYRKTVAIDGAVPQETDDRYWLYNGALILPLPRGWLGYMSYTRGLEEKGVAPANAANRNEVLPAVMARQVELGVRGRVHGRLSLAAGLFEIVKPTTGFDEQGRFGLQGTVRHRGVELSLSGPLTDRLTIATGAVFLDPENSGPAVETGLIAHWPAGQSRLTAQFNMEYRLPVPANLSVDVQLTHNSTQPADMADRFRTGANSLFDIGARYRLALAGRPTTLRFRVQNLLNDRSWSASGSGTLSRVRPRAFTLTALASL